MLDFPIVPEIVVRDAPKPRRIKTLNEARAFVDEQLRLRRFAGWREMLKRLDGAKNEEEAIEAIGALRELLAMEDLLMPAA
jgi:hypothetical protein